jgi:hypothetical protein
MKQLSTAAQPIPPLTDRIARHDTGCAGHAALQFTVALLIASLVAGTNATAAGRWVIVTAEGQRLGGEGTGVPEYHASEADCLAYKTGVVERAQRVAKQRSGASTSPLAETWATARCISE